MHCHEVDYKIIGDDMQMVEVELDPGKLSWPRPAALAKAKGLFWEHLVI